jgi:hypothetical protein
MHSRLPTVPYGNVRIGLADSSESYRDLLRASGCKIGPWGEQLLSKIPLLGVSATVTVYFVSPQDCGFAEMIEYSVFLAAANARGFSHPHPEVLLALRLEYPLESVWPGRILCQGLPGIDARVPLLIGSIVNDHEGKWLDGGGYPEFRWHEDTRFAFVRGR